jgi:hypothetical protein
MARGEIVSRLIDGIRVYDMASIEALLAGENARTVPALEEIAAIVADPATPEGCARGYSWGASPSGTTATTQALSFAPAPAAGQYDKIASRIRAQDHNNVTAAGSGERPLDRRLLLAVTTAAASKLRLPKKQASPRSRLL